MSIRNKTSGSDVNPGERPHCGFDFSFYGSSINRYLGVINGNSQNLLFEVAENIVYNIV